MEDKVEMEEVELRIGRLKLRIGRSGVGHKKSKVRRRKNMKGGNSNLDKRLEKAQNDGCPLDLLQYQTVRDKQRHMSHPLIVMGGTLPKYGQEAFKSCTNKKTIFFF